MSDKVAIVIVTYNRQQLLKECLDCALGQTYSPFRVIVVNNASTDGTKEWLQQMAAQSGETLQVIHETENIGGAGGFYDGMKESLAIGTDWTLVIDDDAMLDSRYIERIMEASVRYPSISAFSGSVLTNSKIVENHRRRIIDHREAEVGIAEYDQDFYYDISTFCGLMVKKSLIEVTGLPIREFFYQYDDTEYCMRFHPYTAIVNVKGAFLNHKTVLQMPGAAGSRELSLKSYYSFRNSLYTYLKYGYYKEAYRCTAWLIKQTVRDMLDRNLKNDIRKMNRWIRFRSIKDAYKGKLGKWETG